MWKRCTAWPGTAMQCRAGARVVGMCSHVAAIIWFQERCKVRKWGEHIEDAALYQIDSSDSE